MSSEQRIARAQRRAEGLYRSPGFQAAYVKGALARLNGRKLDDCPYVRKRGWQAHRKAWLAGFADAQ